MKRADQVASHILAAILASLLLTLLLQPRPLSAQWLSDARASDASLSSAAVRPIVELSAYALGSNGPILRRSRNFIITGAIIGGVGGYLLRPANTSEIEYIYPAAVGGYVIGGAVIGAVIGYSLEGVSRPQEIRREASRVP